MSQLLDFAPSPNKIRNAARGGDIDLTDEAALKALEKRRADHQAYLQKYEGQAFSGVSNAMESMPHSALQRCRHGRRGGRADGSMGRRVYRGQGHPRNSCRICRMPPTEGEWAAISFLTILGPVDKETFASLGIKSALERETAELAATNMSERYPRSTSGLRRAAARIDEQSLQKYSIRYT